MDIKDLIDQLSKKYSNYLKNKFAGHPFTPIPLRGVRKYPEEVIAFFKALDDFNAYNKEKIGKGWTIDWREVKKFGRQYWPSAITVDTEGDFLFLIGKKSSTEKILRRFDQLMQWQPSLQQLFEKYPDLIEKHEPLWDKLMPTLDYLLQHSVKGKLIRDISIPADTKFLERNQKILLQLLKCIDPERGDPTAKTLEEFLELGSLPDFWKMYWLDEQMAQNYTNGEMRLSKELDWLRNIRWENQEIWLVENLKSLYDCPPRKNALAIFSRGFDLHRLKGIHTFQQARLYYWGDLDEHGFIMLSQMRELYPQVQSVFMDINTLQLHIEHLHHVPFVGKERPRRLTPAEWEAFDFLEENNGRIEQERIRGDYLIQYIGGKDLGGADPGGSRYSNFT
jgi:hypothetical protein